LCQCTDSQGENSHSHFTLNLITSPFSCLHSPVPLLTLSQFFHRIHHLADSLPLIHPRPLIASRANSSRPITFATPFLDRNIIVFLTRLRRLSRHARDGHPPHPTHPVPSNGTAFKRREGVRRPWSVTLRSCVNSWVWRRGSRGLMGCLG
jgi:hypothetical protein